MQAQETVQSGRQIHGQAITPLISAEELDRRVGELAGQISADYDGKELVVVGVLKGAWVFMADLVRRLAIPVTCDFIKVSSYGAETETSGRVTLRLDVTHPVKGRHVLLVEDIVDTGICLAWLVDHLASKGALSLRVCALLDKPSRRRVPAQIDYLGFTVPDRFVVGYGIDCRERYRELPYVGSIAAGDGPDAK